MIEIKILILKEETKMFDVLGRINHLIKRHGISKDKLGKITGITRPAVRSWFNRGHIPHVSNIELVCKAFNMSLNDFFSDKDKETITSEEKMLLMKLSMLKPNDKQRIEHLMNV